MTSRLDSFAKFNPTLYTGNLDLSQTSKAVYQLVSTLPYHSHRFTLYMDNYFTNIHLLSALRDIGIGGCGTARPNSKEYPASFKFGQRKPCFPHNTISGVVCRDVLAVLWQDNNLVRFLTTVHSITGCPNPSSSTINWPLKERRRPRFTPYNRHNIEFAWGNQAYKSLPIPQIAIDYNMKMNGVDLSDQFRCYYATQLRVSRNWMPLFFWLLDITTINSWIICNEYRHCHGLKSYSQREYRVDLAWELAQHGFHSINPTHAANLKASDRFRDSHSTVYPSPAPFSFSASASSSYPTDPSSVPTSYISPNGRHCPSLRPLGNSSISRQGGMLPLTGPI